MSKRRPKTSLVNLLRNKKTAIAAAVCVVVAMGAYVGVHMYNSHAEDTQIGQMRGVINDISEIKGKKSGAKRTMGIGAGELGSAENPFVYLEIVPWQGVGNISYCVTGCQAVDIEKVSQHNNIGGSLYVNKGYGIICDYAFPEENYPGKDGAAEYNGSQVRVPWKLTSDEKTVYGYYEKVNPGQHLKGNLKPTFVIDEAKTAANGGEHPVFRQAHVDEIAQYIWVSMSDSQDAGYKNHKATENVKFASGTTVAVMNSKYKVGDREYTSRTGQVYQYQTQWENGIDIGTTKMYFYDDFLRYSLRLRSRYEVENYNIVFKTIEPWELNEHPEWLDYADMIYMHKSDEDGAAIRHYQAALQQDPDGSKGILHYDTSKSKNAEGATFGKYGNGEYKDKQNDITFEIALKMFYKANKLEQYKGTQRCSTDSNLKLNYAPVIMPTTFYQVSAADGYDAKSVNMSRLDWETMKPKKNSGYTATGYNNNIYKFCVMDLLMDQKNFYNMFLRNRVATGTSVVDKTTGEVTPFTGDARSYWHPHTFLPIQDLWPAYIKKYGLNMGQGGTAPMNFEGNLGVLNNTMFYNSNMMLNSLANTINSDTNNPYMGQVFDYYNKKKEHKDKVTSLDIIHYLLNYDKSDSGNNGKDGAIEILDIEPCSDFSKMTLDYLYLLFPESDQYSFDDDSFNITHMTTAELNGSKEDLSKYDLIYFGDSTGKLNSTASSIKYTGDKNQWGGYNEYNYSYDAPAYNDSSNNGEIFLHTGDLVKGENGDKYRLSGNDLTSISSKALQKYVKSGKAMLLPDVLHMGDFSNNSAYAKIVSKKSNTRKFLQAVGDSKNVFSTSAITSSNLISFAPKSAKVKITDTPPIYNNPSDTTEVKDESTGAESTVNKTAIEKDSDGKYKLKFTFKIGYASKKQEYAVRLLVDKNGDGVISDNETGADVMDSWNSTVSAGQTFSSGTMDDEGNEEPAEYNVAFTIPEEQTNGPIAWRFTVYNTANENIYYQVSGISLYKGDEEDGEAVIPEVKVLQIVSDDKKDTAVDLESGNAELFKKYAKLDDYKINVTTITLSEYLKHFAEVNASDYKGDKTTRTLFSQSGDNFYYPMDYMDYHIFLFSCGADLQKASNKDGAVAFAAWVAKNDKSVIYTDNLINAGTSNGENRKMLKDTSGLSRYTSKDETTSSYNDTATGADGEKLTSKDYTELEYTYDQATLKGTTANSYLAYKNGKWTDVKGQKLTYADDHQQKTTKGSRANNGTVCNYPYTIGESLSLTGARAQDYQLNLEIPDADVWYCLGDNQGRGAAAGKLNTYYAMSPNDAANNYYLYNVANVFYDAIDLENTTKDQEMQLFINTLIGAYEFSYGTPYVTVDKVTKINGDAEKLVEDKVEVAERNYSFEVTAGEKEVKTLMFKEYLKQEKNNVVHSAKPAASAEPSAEPTEEPKPTTTPAPVTVWENTTGGSGNTFSSNVHDQNSWLKDLDNNAIVQFTYTCTMELDPTTPVWDVYGGYSKNEWTKCDTHWTACVGDSENATEIQILQMTVKDMKEMLGVRSQDDIDVFKLCPYNYNRPEVKLLSVKLYAADYDGDYDSGNNDPKKPKVDKVKKKDVFGDSDTHIIFFTPHEGNTKGVTIKQLHVQFTGVDNDKNEAISLPVTKIYRSLGDGEYERITAPQGSPGQFNDTLVDGRQYFVTYDKENANKANTMLFNKLEFNIQNDRKVGKTILEIIGIEKEKKNEENVYMFNLD